jgi:hypothetical protein
MEKVQIKKMDNIFILFPPLEEAKALIGSKHNLYLKVKSICEEQNRPLPVSAKTLRKAQQDGISKKSFLKAINLIFEKIEFPNAKLPKDELIEYAIENRLFDLSFLNGLDWELQFKVLSPKTNKTFPRTIQFVKQRALVDEEVVNLVCDGSRKAAIDKVCENILLDPFLIYFFYNNHFSTGTLIVDEKNKLSALPFLTDFYLWLLAYIDCDIYNRFIDDKQISKEENCFISGGFLQHILPSYSNNKRKGALSNLLDQWRKIYSTHSLELNKPMGPYMFSSLLPDSVYTEKKVGEMSDEEQRQSKYRMFCHWIRGEKRPSFNKGVKSAVSFCV